MRGLYAITDGARPGHDLVELVALALHGGARIIQYRDKSGDRERRHDEARQLLALCRSAGALFIVNDDTGLARAVGADGVHLGRDDPDPQGARRLLGAQTIVGVSCYDSLERARNAAAAGASYLAFGSFFPSPTKPDAVRPPVELLTQAGSLGVPVCAIGGITPENGPSLIAAGADMLAVISGLWDAPDVEARARAYAACWSSRNG